MTSDPKTVADIDPTEAKRLVGEGALLLDVREDEEWDAGHAPEAVHLAMGLVSERIDELPTDRTIVCVCRVGGRSGAVASSLLGAGYDVRNIDGGMLAWEAMALPVVDAHGGAGRVI